MKVFSVLMVMLGLLGSTASFATDGQTTGCFGIAATVLSNLIDGNYTSLPTAGTVCLTEKNVQKLDADGIMESGLFTLTIRDAKNQVLGTSVFTASEADNGMGHAYRTLGPSQAVIEAVQSAKDTSGAWQLATFDMRNDHILPGEVAGHLTVGGSMLTLIQK